MQPQTGKRKRTGSTHILSLSGIIFLLLFLSGLIVACGGTGAIDTNATTLNGSAVTATIHLGNNNTIIVPTPKAYTCAAWATETTPAVNSTTVVGVYAKFIHNVDGNPVGVAGATATAIVSWGADAAEKMTVSPVNPTTGTDGLAIFKVDLTNLTTTLNKVFLVQVQFKTQDGTQICTTDSSPAYFTLVMVSPTADNGTPTDNNGTPTNNGNNNGNGKKKHHG